MELPLAGLHQLVGAWMLERVENLPAPGQQEALRLAFGFSSRHLLRIASCLVSLRSACCPTLPRSGRSCA